MLIVNDKRIACRSLAGMVLYGWDGDGMSELMTLEDAREFSQSLGQIGEGWFRQVALGVKMRVPEALGLSRTEWCSTFKVSMRSTERAEAVQELHEDGHSNRAIADVLGVDPRTVRRDFSEANAPPDDGDPEEEDDESEANAPPDSLTPDKIDEMSHWAGARNMVDMLDMVDVPIERARELAGYVRVHLEPKNRKKVTPSRARHGAEFLIAFAVALEDTTHDC